MQKGLFVPSRRPPSRATLAALAAKYGSPAHAEATRKAFLDLLCRGRAIPASPWPRHMPTSLDGDTEGLIVEHTSIEVEIGERCPLLLCRAKEHAATALRPVFVMHGTGQSLDGLLLNGHLQRFARRGMLAVGVDARHHGGRCGSNGSQVYWEALCSAWRAPEERPPRERSRGEAATAAPSPSSPANKFPFIWDTVYDLMRALDWLESRPDVDCSRVGATGISLVCRRPARPHRSPRPAHAPLEHTVLLQGGAPVGSCALQGRVCATG